MANDKMEEALLPAANYYFEHTRMTYRTVARHGYAQLPEVTAFFKVTHTEDGVPIEEAFPGCLFPELNLKPILIHREVLPDQVISGQMEFQQRYGYNEPVRDASGAIQYEMEADGVTPKVDATTQQPVPKMIWRPGLLTWNGKVGKDCKVGGKVVGRVSTTLERVDPNNPNRKFPAKNFLNDIWAAPTEKDEQMLNTLSVRTDDMAGIQQEAAMDPGAFFDRAAGANAAAQRPSSGPRVAVRAK